MKKEDFEMFEKMDSWQLIGFFNDRDSSDRRHLAKYILDDRFNKPVKEAALASAEAARESVAVAKENVRATRDAISAARWSAWAAWASFGAAIIALINSLHS